MAVPDFQTLMLPVLKELGAAPSRISALTSSLADVFGLNDLERWQLLPSGRQPVIKNRVHWAVRYFNKAGLIERVWRGEYAILPAGRTLVKSAPNRVTVGFLSANFPVFRIFHKGPQNASLVESQTTGPALTLATIGTPAERIGAAVLEHQACLVDEFLQGLRSMPPMRGG